MAEPAAPSLAGAPGPPPGPGVQPPFVAAPVEGRTARLWLSLGIGAALVALCCGVATVAVGGVLFTDAQAITEQAERAVDDYLGAVVEEDWERAYRLRCEADRRAETLEEFTRRVSAPPRIESYQLGEFEPLTTELALPVDVTYTDGTAERLRVPLERDTGTGQFEVCGFER